MAVHSMAVWQILGRGGFWVTSVVVCGLLAWLAGPGFWDRPLVPGQDATSQSQRVMRLNLGTEPPDLDPIKVIDLTSFNVVLNVMRGLTCFGQGQEVLPSIASHWDVNAAGTRYTFHLRRNTAWSDGQPVRAQDFVHGWKRALTAANGADYAFFLFPVKNAKAYYDGTLSSFDEVGVRAVDESTLEVTLERPVAYFLALMAAPIAMPIRQDVVDRYGPTFTEAGHFIGNGPYQLAQWRHDEQVVLTPNPHYYETPTGVDRIEMVMVNDANTSVVMYENGQLDFVESPSTIPVFDIRRLRHRPEAETRLLHAIYYMGINVTKPPMDDVRVRKAFAMALDRQYYPDLLQSGQKPYKSLITPGLTGATQDIGIAFNPKKARELLAEAGYPNGYGFPTVSLAFRTGYDIQKEMEIAQYSWKKHLNVNVKLENMDWKVFLARMKQNPPHLFRLNWYVDYPDADSFMSLFIGESGNNFTRWNDPQYDAWVKEAAELSDENLRQQLYNRAQALILETDVAIIPIYVGEKLFLLNPDIEGLVLNELNLMLLDQVHVNRSAG